MPAHVFGAPQCWPFRTNGGVCQLAQNGPILIINTIYCNKSKFKVYISWKKLPSLVIRTPWGGTFWSKPWLRMAKYGPINFFGHFVFKNKIILGQFYAKICYLPKLAYSVLARQPMAIILFFLILGLSFNFQTNTLLNGLTNPFFGPWPLPEKFFLLGHTFFPNGHK